MRVANSNVAARVRTVYSLNIAGLCSYWVSRSHKGHPFMPTLFPSLR